MIILRTMVDKAVAESKTLYITYPGIRNASPSMDRDALWVKLAAMGILRPIIDWLKKLYNKMGYVVRSRGELSRKFLDLKPAQGFGSTPKPAISTRIDDIRDTLVDWLQLATYSGSKNSLAQLNDTSLDRGDRDLRRSLYLGGLTLQRPQGGGAMPQDSKEEESPPLSYKLPHSFKIGKKQTDAPFVTSAQLKGHLALLDAFSQLRAKIDGHKVGDWSSDRHIPDDKYKRWVWFVGFAVERFEIWAKSLTLEDASRPALEFLPPLDVLMTEAPPMKMTSDGLKEVLADGPSHSRLQFWHSRAKGRSFDLMEDASRHRVKTIACPLCRKLHEIPYIHVSGTGYFQNRFFVACCAKSYSIVLGTLALRKFAEDLVREDEGARTYFAGTVRTTQTSEDLSHAQFIKEQFLSVDSLKRPAGTSTPEEWITSIIHVARGSFTNLTYQLPLKTPETREPLFVPFPSAISTMESNKSCLLSDRILAAYGARGPFSVDLVGAVIRQGSFIKKMYDLKWTEPTFFDGPDDELALQHAIARYHGFLDLMAAAPSSFHVPTLDIDLAWHTHQLLGEKYNADCLKFVGRYVDQYVLHPQNLRQGLTCIDSNDKVAEHELWSAFDLTCRAWNDRFNVPYTHCGCPLPGERIGERLSHLVRLHNTPTPHLIPPSRGDVLAATHPSEHDSIVYASNAQSTSALFQYERRKKLELRVARDARASAGAAAKPKYAHDPRAYPFMMPVPYLLHGPACAAHSGHVVSGRSHVEASLLACMPMPKPYVYVPPPPREPGDLLGMVEVMVEVAEVLVGAAGEERVAAMLHQHVEEAEDAEVEDAEEVETNSC
ncbi:hypothetical protein DXG01_006180 [Tephrocybe rancida]|nr:hypothetical protein DXG01_006180 [Tephrocybe rancida]